MIKYIFYSQDKTHKKKYVAISSDWSQTDLNLQNLIVWKQYRPCDC